MPTKSIKVPQSLTRAATIERDADGKAMSVSISSDEPYRRYDWWNDEEYYEVLSHEPGGIDEERLKAGLPILFNHDRSAHLARAGKYSNDGHKLTLDMADFKWAAGEFAENKRKDMESGALPTTSVGYELIGDGVCIGAKDELPVYKFRWRLFEASAVTIPADISVGVGRQRDKEPGEKPREVCILDASDLQKEVDQSSKLSHTRSTAPAHHISMETTPAPAAETKPAAPVVDAAKERAAALTEFKARCKKIDEFVSGLRNAVWKERAAKIAAKHKDGDADFDAFRTEALDSFNSDVQLEAGSPAESRESAVAVLGERREQKRPLSFGQRFTQAEGFKRCAATGGRERFRMKMDAPSESYLGRRAEAAMATRAGFTSSDLAAINITTSSGLIALGIQRLTIMDLISPGTMSTEGFVYPIENSFDPFAEAATEVGERGVKPEWEPDLTTDRADAKVIAVMMSVPKQFMSDFSAFSSYIDARGEYLVDIRTERQFLYGDGLGDNLKGILNREGVQTRALGGDTTPDALFRALTDIQINSYFEPDGYAINPLDWEQIRLLKDENGQYIAGGPFYAPYGNGMLVKFNTLWGNPVAVTKSVTQGKPIAGAWKLGAQYFIREGMSMDMSDSHKDYFGRNLLALLFEQRVALAVYRPNCFVELSGFPGRS